ncbi:four helix bundle protein [Merismopedia glauca]|uniref:Four helix bundle protein n=1 Tax=Merismopedia glauca CCAP 1448/3 TaxID=1296344 RepID=A0A2T1C291_9CYAN|nr:four helix bundle protein [Merismopedia glauca]PSB02390.1 four helix bundle protein [Merismopedia glauca CCAP 1448/3]
MDSEISIQDRSKKFAIRIVKTYSFLEKESITGRILGQQLLRSGTSIGANCQEAQSAQSRRDFIHKYEIALKEARETLYWIELIVESGLVTEPKFSLLKEECNRIIKILVSSINSLKANS